MKTYKIITIILIGIMLLGCGKLGNESDLLTQELIDSCNSQKISGNVNDILKGEDAIIYLKKILEEYPEPAAGTMWHVIKVNKMYDKVVIYTDEETKDFVFREIKYNVGAFSGNNFYYCDIPNGCEDYYIEFYSLNKNK